MKAKTPPTNLIIFGASGDLTKRKLIPALFLMHCKGRIPAGLKIIGFAVTPRRTAEFKKQMQKSVKQFASQPYSGEEWRSFAARCSVLLAIRKGNGEKDLGDHHPIQGPAAFDVPTEVRL